jgi:hypothetical protein
MQFGSAVTATSFIISGQLDALCGFFLVPPT